MVELSNSALTNIANFTSNEADLSITINRSDLNEIMMGAKSFDEQIDAGKATLKGDRKPIADSSGG